MLLDDPLITASLLFLVSPFEIEEVLQMVELELVGSDDGVKVS